MCNNTCPQSYFGNTSTNTCDKCQSNCSSCNTLNFCTSCITDYYIVTYTAGVDQRCQDLETANA